MKDIISRIIKETFKNIPLPDQEEVLKQVESILGFLSQYETLRRITISEITLKVLKEELAVHKTPLGDDGLAARKAEAKLFIDANVWDGEDRSGATGDGACFNPDELQELIDDLVEHLGATKGPEGEAPSTEDMGHIMREADEKLQKPPCLECGAMTAKEAETMCICGGDKDYCHGQDLWPDDEEVRTPDEWAEEMGFEIIDPDGWRWKCGELEPRPYSEEISRKEFNVRAIRSTIRPKEYALEEQPDGTIIPVETTGNEASLVTGPDALLEAVKGIRKSDCGAWLKDCNGIHRCSEGREKRQELMRLLDKLYKAANTITEKTPCLALEIVSHAAMMGCKCQSTGPGVEENRHWQSCIVGKAQAYLGRKVSRQGGE